MNCYAITIRLRDGVDVLRKDFIEELIKKLSSEVGGGLICEHKPSNHLHGYIFTENQRESVRKFYERLLNKYFIKGENYIQKYAIKILNVTDKFWKDCYLTKHVDTTILFLKEWEGEDSFEFHEITNEKEEGASKFNYLKSQILDKGYKDIFTQVKRISINEFDGTPRNDIRKQWTLDLWSVNNDRYDIETIEEMKSIDKYNKDYELGPKLKG